MCRKFDIIPSAQLSGLSSLNRFLGRDDRDIQFLQNTINLGVDSIQVLIGQIDDRLVGVALMQSLSLKKSWMANVKDSFKKWRQISCSNTLNRSPAKVSHNVYYLSAARPLQSTHLNILQLLNKQFDSFAIGTEFQCAVWKVLTEIPIGKTVTYQWVAEQVGTKAVRAVGTAIGNNPLAIIIPCHRVIRKSGELGGYRWGVPIKKMLLDYEQTL